MRAARILDYFWLCVLLATLSSVAGAGVSKGVSKRPGPSRVRTSEVPQETPTPALCRVNTVQCCNATTESNTTAAATIFERLQLDIPKETVEIGFNCTLISDEDVRGGFCDDSILCCRNIFNDTLLHDGVNSTVGVNCTDVGL